MTKTESLIAQAYSAFNQRNVDEALALMSASVIWDLRRFWWSGLSSNQLVLLSWVQRR